MKQIKQITTFLKVSMYVSEILLLNILFYSIFRADFATTSLGGEMPVLYNWIATMLVLCYFLAVWCRPISFFRRSTRAGAIVQNVIITNVYMALFGAALLFLLGRISVLDPMKLVFFFAFNCVALMIWRFSCRAVTRYIRCRGHNLHRAVFVGGGENLMELYEEMKNPFYGYQVDGYFCETNVSEFPEDLKYLGGVNDVIPYLKSHYTQQLYCSLPSAMASDIKSIINYCENNCIRFFSVPNVRNYLKKKMQMEILGSVPVLYIREDPLMSIENRFLKRSFDVLVSGLFLIPFWLFVFPIVGAITKITSPGPVFFKQMRNGLNGEIFYCYKFRSMKVNADADKIQATENDPRKTKFGDFLRKSSIDELPQFINVLKGDMSIVGPRPHMLKHTKEYSALIDKYMVRHWVRPGITGWAQVTGARGETKYLSQMEDRIKKDVWYIENWTFFLDLKIIFLTVYNAVAGDKQAY